VEGRRQAGLQHLEISSKFTCSSLKVAIILGLRGGSPSEHVACKAFRPCKLLYLSKLKAFIAMALLVMI